MEEQKLYYYIIKLNYKLLNNKILNKERKSQNKIEYMRWKKHIFN